MNMPQLMRHVRTAMALGGRLTGIEETLMITAELERAKSEGHLLVVRGEGLPETAGWYKIDRKTASITPIANGASEKLRNDGCWDKVLRVDQSAVDASSGKGAHWNWMLTVMIMACGTSKPAFQPIVWCTLADLDCPDKA